MTDKMSKHTQPEMTVQELIALCRKAISAPRVEDLLLPPASARELPVEAAALLAELARKNAALTRVENLLRGEGARGDIEKLIWPLEQKLSKVKQGDYEVRFGKGGLLGSALNSLLDYTAALEHRLKIQENDLGKLMLSLESTEPKKRTGLDELKASEARFRYLAEHDELTKTYSRVYFMRYALKALKSAKRKTQPCCLAIMDLDFFKTVNDCYGHLAGDRVLADVAMVAGMTLRAGDTMARYGGEEFVFFFNNTTLEQGFTVAERIRGILNSHPVSINDRESLMVTVSLGVVCSMPEHDGDRDKKFLDLLLHQADKAMYRAKRQGRNQCCLAQPVEKFGCNRAAV